MLEHHGLGTLFEWLHACSREGGWEQVPGLVDDDGPALFVVRADSEAVLHERVHDWIAAAPLHG